MQRLLLFAGFMALGTGLIYFIAVREPPAEKPVLSAMPAHVLNIEGVRLKEHDGATLRLELSASRGAFYERSQEARLEEVRFIFYGKTHGNVHGNMHGGPRRTSLRGRADQARLQKRKGWLVLRGDVRIIDRAGTEIRSEEIRYDQQHKKVISPSAARVIMAGVTHQGSSLVYDMLQEQISFTAPSFYQ